MKDGAMVVNTARGKLIDPKALYEALNNGKLRTAALDVHYEEPIPKEYALAKFDNVILTPHIAGLTYEAFYAMMSGAVENIVTFEKGNIDKIKNKRLL
jgi:D-3-phosphoglycerate dehydrogenase